MVNFKSALLIVYLTVFSLPAVAGSKNLTIAYPTPTWNTGLPTAVAQDLGFFAAEGLEVNAVLIRGGPTVIAALVGGDTDYAIVAGVPAVTSIARGAPLVIVGGYSAQVDYALIGAKTIKSLADLKGTTIGVTGAGGLAEFATVEALAKKGLYRDKDYRILYAGNSPARLGSLQAGRIQAAPFSAGERVPLEQKGYPVLLDIGETLPDLPFLVMVTSRRKMQTAPDEVVSVLKAFNRAMDAIKRQHEAVVTNGVIKLLRGNPNVERNNISHYGKNYSIRITEANIKSLIRAANLQDEAAKIGGAGRFFVDDFAKRASAGN